ncbi:MAG: hypothetical protein JXR37_06105 [Kiritimatiellae bacterium]|nr:hypothetical protein [Kiritimatiellia bacterium]
MTPQRRTTILTGVFIAGTCVAAAGMGLAACLFGVYTVRTLALWTQDPLPLEELGRTLRGAAAALANSGRAANALYLGALLCAAGAGGLMPRIVRQLHVPARPRSRRLAEILLIATVVLGWSMSVAVMRLSTPNDSRLRAGLHPPALIHESAFAELRKDVYRELRYTGAFRVFALLSAGAGIAVAGVGFVRLLRLTGEDPGGAQPGSRAREPEQRRPEGRAALRKAGNDLWVYTREYAWRLLLAADGIIAAGFVAGFALGLVDRGFLLFLFILLAVLTLVLSPWAFSEIRIEFDRATGRITRTWRHKLGLTRSRVYPLNAFSQVVLDREPRSGGKGKTCRFLSRLSGPAVSLRMECRTGRLNRAQVERARDLAGFLSLEFVDDTQPGNRPRTSVL